MEGGALELAGVAEEETFLQVHPEGRSPLAVDRAERIALAPAGAAAQLHAIVLQGGL
jgi:hypothetical protein